MARHSDLHAVDRDTYIRNIGLVGQDFLELAAAAVKLLGYSTSHSSCCKGDRNS